MRYWLIRSTDPAELQAKVSQAMDDHWQLYGDPFVAPRISTTMPNGETRHINWYCQALKMHS